VGATVEEIVVSEVSSPRKPGPVRALVAEDFIHMQNALVACLQTIPDVQVVATALNGREALEKVRQTTPDLAVVDLQMPVMNGFRLMQELRRVYPDMVLVAVSGHQSPAIEQEALSAGADAFVSKTQLPSGLVNTVERLLAC
jgi:DNA-binding NarL/FixJ family response regulator